MRNDVVMKWFRLNIRHGTRLALLALSIQFVLSFGHFHAIEPAQATTNSSSHGPNISAKIAAAIASAHVATASGDQHRSDRDSDHAADLCAICAVVAMVNTATPAPALPPLQLPDAVGQLNWLTANYVVPVEIGRLHFQPRAPPIT